MDPEPPERRQKAPHLVLKSQVQDRRDERHQERGYPECGRNDVVVVAVEDVLFVLGEKSILSNIFYKLIDILVVVSEFLDFRL